MRVTNNLWAIAVLCAVSTSVLSGKLPMIHPNEIIAKYGEPDRTRSTEYDKPRPPFVTRMLEYKKERVRFTFLPTAPIGSPPPFTSWYLLGMQDPTDNSVISREEADRRMQARLTKK